MATKSRVKVPGSVVAGEVFNIRSLVSHRMESGHRRDQQGKPIPRQIINHFSAAFNGVEFFSVVMGTGVAANPYLEFPVRIEEAGTFTFRWTDDDGNVVVHEEDIALEG